MRMSQGNINAALPVRNELRKLLRGYQRFVEARFVASGSVPMNNAALRSFVDRRDDRADLISTGRCRETHLLLNRPQTSYNAVITKGALRCLA
jgi:hypothetical protein